MARKTRDLFDDTTMSFGEHLEVLRKHLIRALLGLVVAVVFTLMIGDTIIAIVRSPIDRALERYGIQAENDIVEGVSGWGWLKKQFGWDAFEDITAPTRAPAEEEDLSTVTIKVKARDLAEAL